MNKKAYGFTIVELLIVIIVIGILSAISVVAYNGVRSNAEETRAKAEFREISQALEMYWSEHGHPPICPTPDSPPAGWAPGWGCEFYKVAPMLDVSGISTKLSNGVNRSFVAVDDASSGSRRWAVMMRFNGTTCKAGYGMYSSWWSNMPACWE